MVEDKFNAKFKFWYVDPNKWDDNVNVRLGAGEMPDVIKVRTQKNLVNYIDQGVLAPISRDLIDKFAPTYAKYLDTTYPETWDYVKSGGKLYGIPATTTPYSTLVVWREEWLKNVGITKVPETLAEFEDALYKFRNNDPDKNGKKDTYGLLDFGIPAIMGAFGFPPIDDFSQAAKANPTRAVGLTLKDGKIVFASVQPEMKEALALLQKWYKDGIIDPEFITSENTTGYWANSQAFFNNRIGLTGKTQPAHWRNELNPDNPGDKGGVVWQDFKKAQPNGNIVFGKPPVGPKGLSGTPQWSSYNGAIGITTKAAKDPRKVETVLKMMEAAATDYEYYMNVRYGMKGEGWNEENGKFIDLSGGLSAGDSQQKGRNVLHVQVNYDPFMKKKDPFTFAFGDKVAGFKGYMNMFLPYTDEYDKYAATLGKMTVETYFKIITGEQGVEAFDEYVKKFKENGGDKVEKALNEAYQKTQGK
ncbi:ABC transporter substrate-binding protein [Paenibacillus sp. CC-CFT747]|nr:ABC transporter substrate-binding protein [Paenibacillus sp. CC-CFT747]